MTSKPQAKYLHDYQPPTHAVENLSLTFELDPQNTQVTARFTLTAQSGAKSVMLDGVELTLNSVKVNGQNHSDYTLHDTGLELHGLSPRAEIEIVNTISPGTNTSLEGLYLSDGAYCTQCEAEGFRKITYFLDRPDVLTTYQVKIVGPKEMPYLLSNGNKVDSGELDDGRHYVCWEDPFKKPSYLFALVAGDFDVLSDKFETRSGRQVDLQLFVDKGNLSKAPHAMTSLKKAMAWDEARFDLEYDLDIYMIVAVDFFNMGAMENKGLNVFNSACVLANQETATDRDFHVIESIVGHEYFHNWTGNRVTCRDWFQLSLKEGLTVFRDQEFSSDLGSRALNRIDAVNTVRTHQFAEDAGPMAHPIRPQQVIEMNNFYTVTVYNKGAEVIRMMHTILGEAGFQKGMKLYFERHDGQAVTCDDFVAAMSDANGKDLSQFKLWYNQVGTPKISARTSYDAQQGEFTLHLAQSHADNDPVEAPLHVPVAIELLDQQGQVIAIPESTAKQGKVIELTEKQQSFVFAGLKDEPVIVLLEDFSAPCTLHYDYKQHQLLHIAKFASSDYARWEAIQQLYRAEIRSLVNTQAFAEYRLTESLTHALSMLLDDLSGDLSILAEQFTVPGFDALSADYNTVPVEPLHQAISTIEYQIAQKLKPVWCATYEQLNDDGSLNSAAVATRTMKNKCLFYLALVSDSQIQGWIQEQSESHNMTLKLGAIRAAVNADHVLTQLLLDDFDKQWQSDLLVMDKWFALQASRRDDNCLDNILSLYSHPCFDKANPNRVRALIGAFTRSNPLHFHRDDGQGYALLGDLIAELNQVNPQNASRIITPLLSFKRFDETRQGLMKAQLEKLARLPELSDDLYEKIDKALN
ncbi:aminopeptidase N [Pseudoalteromonas sp. DL2-H2.2]|uniref:aminopeptidase N n=1 Tax=Pseudoalteromonas sp. DL2-H2.2 TaxID=2908889 RepID=UPI001F4673D1|nr:aminopeptidase N [Pseudoalteromonas sp. DL2-H2.2]MCF2909174.1 aminopeptidase N [Pseudoalteromonas sp. DL2-H2.2]